MSVETRPKNEPHTDDVSAASIDAPPVAILRPVTGWVPLGLKEIRSYRELLYFFAWRDIKVRYKQTVLGAGWAILQPLLTMVIFSIFFGRLAGIPSDGVPYPVFSLVALVPWTFFANTVTQASNSLVIDANLITKVYFPRLIVPAATTLAGLVDFILSFGMLLLVMLGYGMLPTLNSIAIPFLLALALAAALGTGLWLAALNVQFRDVRYTVPFLVQAWLFITPIAYPSSLLNEPWRTVYGLNPMAGVVEGFRWALLGTDTAPGPMILASTFATAALLISGMYYFRRMEQTFADVV